MLLITIYVEVHDVTITFSNLSQLFNAVRGVLYPFFNARRDSRGLSTVINTRYVFFFFSLYPMHYSSRTCENPENYNLPFFQRYNGSGTEVGGFRVRHDYHCHRIGPNCKYRILRSTRLTTRIGPIVVLTIRDSMEAAVQVLLPTRYSDVVRAMILNRLIPMVCSCISSTEACVQLKPTC